MTVQRRSACFFFIWECKDTTWRWTPSNRTVCAPSHSFGAGWLVRIRLGEQRGGLRDRPAGDRNTREIPQADTRQRAIRAQGLPQLVRLHGNQGRRQDGELRERADEIHEPAPGKLAKDKRDAGLDAVLVNLV